jgi:ABC-type glycerol-3-phosphate transport system substrate-binding protein
MAPANVNLPSKEKDFVKKFIEEKFNVNLTMNYMADGTDYSNQLNLKLASGDAPDMFMSGGVDSSKYVLDKVSADMDSFITPTTMPNFYKWINENELKRFQIHNRFGRAPVPFQRQAYNSYYIRKDWLDKLGLKIPETYEEMITVIRKFRNEDPDGNGIKDTFGFSTSGNGDTLPYDFPQHHAHNLIAGLSVDNGVLLNSGTDIRLGAVMKDIKKMIVEDVVDPDWFLNKGTQHYDKAAQGKIGVIYSTDLNFALQGVATSNQNRSAAVNPKADWRPFHPWAKSGTSTEKLPGYVFMFNSQTAKTSPEEIKRSVQILDWLTSPEGYLLTHYGQEGKHYTRSGSDIKINTEAYQEDIVEQGDFLRIYSFFTPNSPETLGFNEINPQLSDRDREIIKFVKSYKILPSIGTNVSPPDGFPLGDHAKARKEFTIKALLENADPAVAWKSYQEELMTKHRGNELYSSYAVQVSKVLGIPVRFE